MTIKPAISDALTALESTITELGEIIPELKGTDVRIGPPQPDGSIEIAIDFEEKADIYTGRKGKVVDAREARQIKHALAQALEKSSDCTAVQIVPEGILFYGTPEDLAGVQPSVFVKHVREHWDIRGQSGAKNLHYNDGTEATTKHRERFTLSNIATLRKRWYARIRHALDQLQPDMKPLQPNEFCMEVSGEGEQRTVDLVITRSLGQMDEKVVEKIGEAIDESMLPYTESTHGDKQAPVKISADEKKTTISLSYSPHALLSSRRKDFYNAVLGEENVDREAKEDGTTTVASKIRVALSQCGIETEPHIKLNNDQIAITFVPPLDTDYIYQQVANGLTNGTNVADFHSARNGSPDAIVYNGTLNQLSQAKFSDIYDALAVNQPGHGMEI